MIMAKQYCTDVTAPPTSTKQAADTMPKHDKTAT
jgi:hypothetical protein